MRRRVLDRVTDRPALLFASLFALNLALAADALREPPVWDAAASIFPAAIHLYQSGFDLPDLFRQPGYLRAGPNVHSYSVVTHGTALAYLLTGGGPATFPLLHLAHFLLAAYGLASFTALARRLLDPPRALLLCLLVLGFPLFLVQTRAMYLEIPLFVCTAGALRAQVEGRLPASVAWSALAPFVKEAGCVVGIAVGLLWLFDAGPARRRLARLALALAPVAVFVAFHAAFVLGSADLVAGPTTFGPGFLEGATREVGRCWRAESRVYLTQIPDTALLVAGAAGLGLASFRAFWRERVGRAVGVLVATFLAFHYVALPATGMHCSVLPRYFVQILPFALLVLAWRIDRRWGGAALPGTLLLGIAVCALNRNGILYPNEADRHGPGANFAETERSGAYRRLLAAERQGLALLEQIPPEVPIFNELHHQVVVERPLLGYVSRPLANSAYVTPELRRRRGDLARFPTCFVMNYFSPNLGGTAMRRLLAQADRLPDWQRATLASVEVGRYRSLVFKVWKDGHECLRGFRFAPPRSRRGRRGDPRPGAPRAGRGRDGGCTSNTSAKRSRYASRKRGSRASRRRIGSSVRQRGR
jgi:hypothetical protein